LNGKTLHSRNGLGGGPVTVKIHVGQTGTTDDMVTREFVGNISGISTIGLSVNVTLTADNDIATMEVVGANGESTIVGQQVRPPKLAATRTREEIEPIILAEAHALTIAYWQERLSDANSEEEADNARQKLAALGTLDGVSGGVGSTTDALTEEEKVLVATAGEDGIGGDGTPPFSWHPDTRTITTDGNLQLYNPSGYMPEGINISCALGKIFAGFVQRLLPHADLMATNPQGDLAKGIAWDPNFDSFYPYIRSACTEIGIPWYEIVDAADLPPSQDQQAERNALVRNLRAVFERYGFAEAFATVEESLRSIIASSFPLDLSAGWKNTIGSPYHLGNARNAVDLNMLAGGDKDYGQPISAPAGGKIVGQPNVSIGSITLEFTSSINGQPTTWHMRFLHLPLEEENGKIYVRQRENMDPNGQILYEREIFNGLELAAGEQFAVVGKNGTQLSHLHMEALDPQGRMIDLRPLLSADHLNIPSRAADDSGKEWGVVWDDTIGAWTNAEHCLIFIQDANGWSGGENNVWMAWHEDPSQRFRVTWKAVRTQGETEARYRWVREDDNSQEWNGTDWTQLTLQP